MSRHIPILLVSSLNLMAADLYHNEIPFVCNFLPMRRCCSFLLLTYCSSSISVDSCIRHGYHRATVYANDNYCKEVPSSIGHPFFRSQQRAFHFRYRSIIMSADGDDSPINVAHLIELLLAGKVYLSDIASMR